MLNLTKLLLALSLINGVLHAQTSVSGQALGAAVTTLATNLRSGQVTLPAGGGFVAAAVDALSAPEVSVDALTTMTSGATDIQASTAQSTAHLTNVNVLRGLITAETVIAATSSWVSGAAGRNALGSSFTNLTVNGVPLGSGDYLPAPNTRVDLPGVGYAVLNEQIATGASGITVNMIHVVLRDALTGLTTGEIIVASASTSASSSPAPITVATITVTPDPDTLAANATQQFAAVGQDANGNIVSISPTWAVVANGGSISNTGLFTAGTVAGTFTNTVQASDGSTSGFATVVVTVVAPAPLPAAAQFAVLANAAVTCTDGNITGNVGTFLATPTGSITLTGCPVTGTRQVGDSVAKQAFNAFLNTYAALAPKLGDVCATLTGTLAGVTLSPGAYCFPAAATLTGVLTLNGPSDGIWTFKIGTGGTGALTGSSFSVVMAGGAQPGNVQWWIQQGVTMTDSHFIGTVLGGAAITLTRGSFDGNLKAKADVTITGTAVVGGNGS